MRKKLGLALGAGGSRGVAHIGFLQALSEENVVPDFVTGCSMGAVVGACYCSGLTPEEMKEVAFKVKLKKIAAFNVAPLHANGLMRMSRTHKLLGSLIGAETTFADLKIPFACVATDLVEGRLVVFNEGNVVGAVVASSSIPGAFTPAKRGEYNMLVDGGILERVPTAQLRDMGAEVIIAVDVLGDLASAKRATGKLANTLLRCIDVMDTHITRHIRAERDYIDLWLEPALGNMDQYKIKRLSFAYEQGYVLGKEHAGAIKKLIGE